IEIVGHAAPTIAHAEAAARRWGGRAYSSYTELLRHEPVEAAWICVPPAAHGPIEHDLIALGIPFFVEKPLAVDRRTAEAIADALARSGVIAGVGYQWRALDTLPEVRRVLADNPPRMVLGAWHDATPPPRWWRHQAESGGQMLEQATHLLDLARTLVGEAQVVAATAQRHDRLQFPDADVADVSSALLRFDLGQLGSATGVFTATCLLGGPAAIQLQLVCEGLLISIRRERVLYDTGRECREVRAATNPAIPIVRSFLGAVREQNPSLLTCSYADALRTHRLCCDIRDASA
ncbi:MAG TPA: Gfo/Idh/MocA family oxidoreductase, partial [Herpetosiphonaceae bacterium]